jgi:hypothetical protein
MKPDKPIPLYAPDGRLLGVRSMEAAQRLIRGGYATPSRGRRGHIKAIWLKREDGSSPVVSQVPLGTRYSYLERLEHGRCWALRSLGRCNELQPIFTQVVTDCMVGSK